MGISVTCKSAEGFVRQPGGGSANVPHFTSFYLPQFTSNPEDTEARIHIADQGLGAGTQFAWTTSQQFDSGSITIQVESPARTLASGLDDTGSATIDVDPPVYSNVAGQDIVIDIVGITNGNSVSRSFTLHPTHYVYFGMIQDPQNGSGSPSQLTLNDVNNAVASGNFTKILKTQQELAGCYDFIYPNDGNYYFYYWIFPDSYGTVQRIRQLQDSCGDPSQFDVDYTDLGTVDFSYTDMEGNTVTVTYRELSTTYALNGTLYSRIEMQ